MRHRITGNELKRRRERADLTQQELADHACIEAITLWRMESFGDRLIKSRKVTIMSVVRWLDYFEDEKRVRTIEDFVDALREHLKIMKLSEKDASLALMGARATIVFLESRDLLKGDELNLSAQRMTQ